MAQARGMYLISMVAQTLDMHPQTLRKYERAGFVSPLRMGTLRTYTDEDVARLRLIKRLVEDMGLNLAGVEMALGLMGDLMKMRSRMAGTGDADSVRRIDGMLGRLGVRVAEGEVEFGEGMREV